MQSEALKLAKLEARTKRTEALSKTAVDLMKNPIVEFAAGMSAIHLMEVIGTKDGNHILEGPEALVARAWVVTLITVQQLAPLVPYAAEFLLGKYLPAGGLAGLPANSGWTEYGG